MKKIIISGLLGFAFLVSCGVSAQDVKKEKTKDKVQREAREDWDKTKDKTDEVWDKTKDGTEKVWDKTKDGTEKVWDKTKDKTEDVWDDTKHEVKKDARKVKEKLD